ncbi:hypothetical protein [Escherichia phage IMM-001]|nr:hypothetical protein [Escherichia phage IMM-001]
MVIMKEKTVSYSHNNGHWVVELKGFHKYPKLSFFMTEDDAKSWAQVLKERWFKNED